MVSLCLQTRKDLGSTGLGLCHCESMQSSMEADRSLQDLPQHCQPALAVVTGFFMQDTLRKRAKSAPNDLPPMPGMPPRPGKRPEKIGSSGPTYMPPMPPGRPPMPKKQECSISGLKVVMCSLLPRVAVISNIPGEDGVVLPYMHTTSASWPPGMPAKHVYLSLQGRKITTLALCPALS